MQKCENCGRYIILKQYNAELYGEHYIVCKSCLKLIEEFKNRHK